MTSSDLNQVPKRSQSEPPLRTYEQNLREGEPHGVAQVQLAIFADDLRKNFVYSVPQKIPVSYVLI